MLFLQLSLLALLSFGPDLGSASEGILNPKWIGWNKDVVFYLYTRSNPYVPQFIDFSMIDPFKETFFKTNLPTKILVHGWTNSYLSPFAQEIKNAYLKESEVNVIVVNWSSGSHNIYALSRRLVPYVAHYVSTVVENLLDIVPRESIHLIGHSLGAHIIGVAGNNISPKLTRITGLDPARPEFTIHDKDRISAESAEFVDIIHTCGERLGMEEPVGTADFYPNGGVAKQPGCLLDPTGICSHAKAYHMFADSITNNGLFKAVPCHSYHNFKIGSCATTGQPVYMGEGVSKSAKGPYYLSTKS